MSSTLSSSAASEWSHVADAGTTVSLTFTRQDAAGDPVAFSSCSIYVGPDSAQPSDVDDFTDATHAVGVISGDDDEIATVPLVVPTTTVGTKSLRLVVDGAVVAIGKLSPTNRGTDRSATAYTITANTSVFALTSRTIGVSVTGIDGGAPDSNYGGTTAIDGGTP